MKDFSVIIGSQEWSTKNLDVSVFRNGDKILQAQSDEEWEFFAEEGLPGWCYDLKKHGANNDHGKIYNWYAVSNPRGLAPEGWKIPELIDFKKMVDFIGEGAFSKITSDIFWNGSNESGLSLLPSGARSGPPETDPWQFIGCDSEKLAYFWSKTEEDDEFSWSFVLHEEIGINYFCNHKSQGYSIRLLKA